MKTYLTGLLLGMSSLTVPVLAQEPEDAARASELEAMEPAVATSEFPTTGHEPADGADETRTALAQGVTRYEGTTGVMDQLDLGRTEVTGNQELPKVLYIVPWQKSGPAELMGKPVNTLLDEVLAPIDRAEFVRQVDYYGDLYGEEKEQD